MATRRTKSIGTKVTNEEYARIEALAGEQTISEWARTALLKAAEPATAGSPYHPAQSSLLRLQRNAANRRGHAAADRAGGCRQARAADRRPGREAVMSQQWGRASGAGTWPRPKPIWLMSVLVLAVVGAVAVGLYRHAAVWTPLQRFYLSAYTRSALASSVGLRTGRYRVLTVENRRGSRLAFEEEVVLTATESGEASFALSGLARQAGSGRLVWRDASYPHAGFHEQLREWNLRRSDLDGIGPALADGSVRRVGRRVADCHPEGR